MRSAPCLLYTSQAERFAGNVAALEKVQPEWIEASDIDVKIGTTWIEPLDYEQFIYELLNTCLLYTSLRDSGNYYDCSSLAYYSWKDAGVDVSYGGATTAAAEAQGLE